MLKKSGFIGAFALVAALGSSAVFAEAPLFGQLLTGSTGGVYDIVGGGISTVVNKNVKDVRLNPSNPPSYSQIAPAVNSGKALMGFSDAELFTDASRGHFEYKTPLENIRVVMALYTNVMSQVTLKDTDITKLSDVKGKRVGVPSVTTKRLVAAMYELAGVPEDSIKWVILPYSGIAEALKDGHVDVGTFTAYPKNGTVDEIASTKGIKFVQLDKGIEEKWNEAHPGSRVSTIPAGTYDGVDEDSSFYALHVELITNKSVDSGAIEKIVKAIYENKKDLEAVHPAGKEVTPDLTIKYIKQGVLDSKDVSEGTKKYFQTIGVDLDNLK